MALDTERKPYAAVTYIFWDMVDFPLPESLPIAKFYDTVGSSLYKYGFGYDMEILGAYGEKLKCNRRFIHSNIHVRGLRNRFVRVGNAAIDMVRATHREGSRWAISEINLMLIIKDVTKAESEVRNVIRALLKEGYGITLVVPDDGIHSAYPYLTDLVDLDLSRITLWNWSSLIEGDGPSIFGTASDDGNQERSPKRDADYA